LTKLWISGALITDEEGNDPDVQQFAGAAFNVEDVVPILNEVRIL